MGVEDTITAWGFPSNLVGNFEYKFKGKVSYFKERRYSLDNGYTFCLWDLDKCQEVVVIDFFITDGRVLETSVRLQLIHIPFEEYRGKEISRFYIQKIKEYALSRDITLMKYIANPKDPFFKVSKDLKNLSKDQLINYYSSFADHHFRVESIG